MFVGHLGAGLAVKAAEPRWNLGVLFAAALFADLLLWVLVLFGVESVGAPVAERPRALLHVRVPVSRTARWRAPKLDAGGRGARMDRRGAPGRHAARASPARSRSPSPRISCSTSSSTSRTCLSRAATRRSSAWGFGARCQIALAVELALAVAALAVCMRRAPLPRWRGALLVTVVAIAGILTALGPYLPGEPPPATTLAASSLVTLAVVVILGFVVEGRARWAAPHGDSR